MSDVISELASQLEIIDITVKDPEVEEMIYKKQLKRLHSRKLEELIPRYDSGEPIE